MTLRMSRVVVHRISVLLLWGAVATLLPSALAVGQDTSAAEDQRENGRRTPWTTSRIHGAPTPPPPYRAEPAFPQLRFNNPTVLTNAPGDDRLFLAELRGKIFCFPTDSHVEQAQLVFDLKAAVPEARQVYGLTFHPNYQENRQLFLCYVLAADLEDGTRLSRFRMRATDPPTIDPESEEILLTWRSGGHNGGCLKFGPDGLLYVSAGDAGPAFPPDPLRSGQDIGNVLSTIMRIDVDRREADRRYGIPADNPFVQQENARPEVWAYGFRNPWKMSFDPVRGDLWVGDVGWELWEMIYRVERGANYGWSLVEGRQPVHRERTRGPTPIRPPTAEHSHTEARSITGGFVYRGRRLPKLRGQYLYGDYVTGKMWSLSADDPAAAPPREIADTQLPIICFGVDNQNELYVVSYSGEIYRLAANPPSENTTPFPRRLSETGLFASVAEHRLADGVVSYEIVAPMWQDGAAANRFLAVPGAKPLPTWSNNNTALGQFKGQWRFPEGAVVGKTIRLPDANQTRIETQILHYHRGVWEPYTYVWNEQQTDAQLLLNEGRDVAYERVDPQSGQHEPSVWRVASRSECMLCHTVRSGALQAMNIGQLDRATSDSPATNQLDRLTSLGFFSKRPRRPRNEPAYADPHDTAADLTTRARAYLHVNCAHCHRRGGGGTASMDVVLKNKLEKTNLIHERPTQGVFGIHSAEVVAPGDPARSVLLYRLAKTGRGRMPYFGSRHIDQRGLLLLRDWIASLPGERKSPHQRQAIDAALGNVKEQRDAALDQLLGDTASALQLAIAAHERQLQHRLDPSAREALTAAVGKIEETAVRDLFEFLLPESERRKTLGDAVDAAEILSLQGDPERGRRLFAEGVGLQCRKCHQESAKQSIGPDLTALKKRSRAELLDAILHPSKRIEPAYVTHLVETEDGRVFTGLLEEENEQRLVLRDATGKRIVIERERIEFSAPQRKSLMPELQLRDSTAQEVADLLEFLSGE